MDAIYVGLTVLFIGLTCAFAALCHKLGERK